MKLASDRWLAGLIAIVSVAYILFAAQAIDRLDPLTGDEPFYIMTTISIVRDRDFDESNNYDARDYDEFYPGDPLPSDWDGWPAFPRTLPPHPATTELDGLHTKHGIGLSLLIAIPYESIGREGAVAIVAACAVLVAANMYFLAREAKASQAWAAAIAAMLAVSMPIAPYAVLIFPEIPAALLLIYSVRRLALPSNTGLQWLLTGAAIGVLPWLHQRFVPTVVVLVVVALIRLWTSRNLTQAVLALGPIALGGFSLVAYNLWLYDRPIQNTSDHAGFNDLTGSINAGFGLLLDSQWGLLIAAPIYLFAIAGIPRWCRVTGTGRLALAALAPYVVVVALYRVWWGEWGPPARYLVPIAPFAAGTLAVVINRLGTFGRAAVIGAWCIGIVLMLVGVANPQRFYHHPDGINNLIATIDDQLGTHFTARLISFQPFAQDSLSQRSIAAVVLIVTLAAVFSRIDGFRSRSRWSISRANLDD